MSCEIDPGIGRTAVEPDFQDKHAKQKGICGDWVPLLFRRGSLRVEDREERNVGGESRNMNLKRSGKARVGGTKESGSRDASNWRLLAFARCTPTPFPSNLSQ